MNTPTILVTGATGNVGRPLVAGLLADAARARALTRDPAAAGFRPALRWPAAITPHPVLSPKRCAARTRCSSTSGR